MATTQNAAGPNPRSRSRKSIAHFPTAELATDKENPSGGGNTGIEVAKGTRKGRSKSIGLGGVDALKEDNGNRQRIAPTLQYKSILKPSVAFSPPKPIPSHSRVHRQSPPKRAEGLLIDVSSPKRERTPQGSQAPVSPTMSPRSAQRSPSRLPTPSKAQTRVAVRTEEEQQQAAAEERDRKEILARKDARRKSLANRRVSFAPEATLHTWDVVEMPEDSTTSSTSGNSTRRASSLTGVAGSPYRQPASPMPALDISDPRSTPPEQVDEVQVKASPAPQRDLHQRKRRRSSGIPPMNFNNPDDFSSSPCSEASMHSDDTSNTIRTADVDESSDSDDKDLVEEETVTHVDVDDNTGHSMESYSTGSSARLEAALKQAAQQAGNQGTLYDGNSGLSMEMADDAVTAAIQPFTKRDGSQISAATGGINLLDKENLNPFSPAFKAGLRDQGLEAERDATMEFTQAVGQILPEQDQNRSPVRHRRKSVAGGRRKSVQTRRRSSGAITDLGDETMEMTTALGKIQEAGPSLNEEMVHDGVDSDNEDEEMTMEFTGVIGGVLDNKTKAQRKFNGVNDDQLAQQQLLGQSPHRLTEASMTGDDTMDMTAAAGEILRSSEFQAQAAEDDTTSMNMTHALGQILSPQPQPQTRREAKELLEREAETGQDLLLAGSNRSSATDQQRSRHATGETVTAISETGSSSLVTLQTQKHKRRIACNRASTPQQTSGSTTPIKKPSTPSKQLTPNNLRPETPGKTPPLKNVSMRSASPKRLFHEEIRQESLPTKQLNHPIFRETMANGVFAPSVILKPHKRRSSGVGADKEGLGSPSVAAILDRRSSIGESSANFKAEDRIGAGVRFEDPRIMEQEIDAEAAQLHHAESGRGVLQQEVDDQDIEEERDITTSLKDMIQSMTPQKKKSAKARKSLHVGAAKGLLGKRPVELDQSDEDSTPKRLRGRQASPVKSIRLPAPPSKDETTGRIMASARLSLKENGNTKVFTPTTHGSPMKGEVIATPNEQYRFKEIKDARSPPKFQPSLDGLKTDEEIFEPSGEADRIQLQEFLNMTSIRFMELTTTRRRHTVAPNDNILVKPSESGDAATGTRSGLEDCIVAGACTVPMLELYQHSCRELKKYISEGRSVVKEIEADTFEDNPPLFREYMTATPNVKSLMDVQFKNVKTHARLLSKAMWYEWRMKLLDGLKEGLIKISEGLKSDAQNLEEQDALIQPALESLTYEHERLEDQVQLAQGRVDELASCDPIELKDARDSLVVVEEEISEKQHLLEQLQSEIHQKEQQLELAAETKEEYRAQSREADRVLEECRGWDTSEVKNLQDLVSALERTYGWSITSATPTSLTMTYRSTLELYFHPSAFNTTNESQENAPISLIYIADSHEHHPSPLTTEKRFFLQIIRAQLQCLQQSTTEIPTLLHFVSESWASACAITEEHRLLNTQFITNSSILSDEKVAIRATVFLQAMATKVVITSEVNVKSKDGVEALKMKTVANARVVYGEALKEKEMSKFLEKGIAGRDGRRWVEAIMDLEERLKARGKKQVK